MITHQDQKIARSQACPNCLRHKDQCICNRIVPLNNHLQVVVLQHPQEQFKQFNSAKLLAMSLEHSALHVGLSWQNHRSVLGEGALPGEWGVLHLKGGDEGGKPIEVYRKGKERVNDIQLKGIIILDGSWKQAKTLWWRNSWLLRLNRISLNPAHPSLRNQVRPDKLCTLEAAALTMRLLGEPDTICDQLLEEYRTLIIEPSKTIAQA